VQDLDDSAQVLRPTQEARVLPDGAQEAFAGLLVQFLAGIKIE